MATNEEEVLKAEAYVQKLDEVLKAKAAYDECEAYAQKLDENGYTGRVYQEACEHTQLALAKYRKALAKLPT